MGGSPYSDSPRHCGINVCFYRRFDPHRDGFGCFLPLRNGARDADFNHGGNRTGKQTRRSCKSGHALEIMGNVNQIAFDKTGTLTTGKLTVTDIVANKNQTKEHVLQTCATAEQRSEHPLAKAVMEHYHNTSTQSLEQNGDFSMQAGLGVSYELANTRIRCGKLAYLKQNNITISAELSEQEIILRKQGKALIFVAENQECIGIVALADSIRGSARTSLATLHNLGIKTTLLTGDSKITADFIAKQIGIDTIHAELLPEEKVQKVQELQTQGNTVCMIGDGINDAPALKIADVESPWDRREATSALKLPT